MANNIRKLGILAALTAILLLAVVLLASSYSEIGIADQVGSGGLSLYANDFLAVPQSVADDASKLAANLFGDTRGKYMDFVNQLVGSYAEARDKDILIVFNPGGWGWSSVERSPGWQSIIDGMESELDGLGYSSLSLNYRRTSETVPGRIKELVEIFSDYPSKAGDLAYRVKFLTDHIPDLKVIIAGESNGSIISDSVMNILRDNPKVYSIQTGPPFWAKPSMLDRTLVLKSNGAMPDSFSDADIPTLLWANLKALLRLSPPEDRPGNVLYHVRAPAHDYSWQYPGVALQIDGFLEKNFGIRCFSISGGMHCQRR